MSTALLESPAARLARSGAARAAGEGRPTLEERLDAVWRTVKLGGRAKCPACQAAMQLEHGAGRCGGCGAALS
jgi:hypothetical protein